MINDYGMSYYELANNTNKISKEEVKMLQLATTVDLVNGTTHINFQQKCKFAKAGGNYSDGYMYQYLGLLRSQRQKAGIRFAKVLNELFN